MNTNITNEYLKLTLTPKSNIFEDIVIKEYYDINTLDKLINSNLLTISFGTKCNIPGL